MRRKIQLLASFLLSMFIVFALSACGTSLQKPTGLEEPEQLPIDSTLEEQEQLKIELGETEETDQEEVIEKEPVETKKEVVVLPKKVLPPSKESETKTQEKPPTVTNKAEQPPKKTEVSNTDGGNKKTEPVANKNEKPVVSKPAPAPAPSQPAKPPAEKPVEVEKEPEPEVNKVVYSIVISGATNEIPLPPTEMEIDEDVTVLEALIEITKKNKIQMDYRGGRGTTAYIEGIANVYEFDRGQGSGWMYSVNGIFPDRGAGAVPLMAGDRVEWLYTTNLGEDLNATLKPFRR